MNELPATVYIGIGAVVAAIITALISFINLITSKDQNISDNRQKWIDAIREDIAKFIGLSAHFTSRLKTIEHTKDENKKDELRIELFNSGNELVELYNRISLRLNPKENKEIINALVSIENFLAGDSDKQRHDVYHMASLTKTLREASQKMLKNEWKRVKRGEFSYFITKWIFITGMVFSLVFGLYQIKNYIDKQEKSLASKQLQEKDTPNKLLQPTPKNGAAE